MARIHEVHFVLVQSSDVERLRTISLDTFTQNFFHLNTPENFDDYTSTAFSLDTLKQELAQKNNRFYFVFLESLLAGYFKINLALNFHHEVDPKSMELQRIYIVDSAQSNGLGRNTIEFIIKLGQSMQYNRIWLGVWEHNLRAIRFYEKHGFIKIGEHPFLLGDDLQTDFLYLIEI